jgi:hypothetical protein
VNTKEIAKSKGLSIQEVLKREKLAGFMVKRGRGAHDFTDEDITALEAVNLKDGD